MASDFESTFKECINADKTAEYQSALTREQNKFSGKVAMLGDNADTNSDATEKTGMSKSASVLKGKNDQMQRVDPDDEVPSPSPLKKHVLIQLEGEGAMRAQYDEERELEERRLEE